MKAPFLICLLLIAATMSGCIEENAENTENEEKTTEATEDNEQYFASFNHITSCTKFVKHDNESMEDYSRNWNESSLSFYLDLCDNLVNVDPAQYNNNNSTHYLPRTILTEDGFRKAIHDQYLLVSMSLSIKPKGNAMEPKIILTRVRTPLIYCGMKENAGRKK